MASSQGFHALTDNVPQTLGFMQMTNSPQALLKHLFQTAVSAADPAACVPQHLPQPPKGRTLVVGALLRVYRERHSAPAKATA